MKAILTLTVVLMLFAGVMAAAAADGVLDLSTLNKKPVSIVALPRLTPTMPTNYTTNYLGSQTAKGVLDLSTLGKKYTTTVATTVIKGPTPITVTPSFTIRNNNVTSIANDIITQPQAISANTTIYTPPIAIFGGA
jgi:ABC-type oligopeptide transport system substrate-binding subunit